MLLFLGLFILTVDLVERRHKSHVSNRATYKEA